MEILYLKNNYKINLKTKLVPKIVRMTIEIIKLSNIIDSDN